MSWRLRHEGPLGGHVKTLAEILGEDGYNTTCVGFSGNAGSRGFQKYLDFSGWGSWEEGRSPKARTSTTVAIPELKTLAAEDKPFFLFLRHMDPHSPYLPPQPFERMFYDGDEFDPNNQLARCRDGVQAVLRLLRELVPAALQGQGLHHRAVRRRGGLHGCLHRQHLRHGGVAGDRGGDADRHRLRPRRDALRPRVLVRPSRHLRPHAAHPAGLPSSPARCRPASGSATSSR